MSDFRLFPVVVDPVADERRRLEAMTDNQRRLYAAQKRINGQTAMPPSVSIVACAAVDRSAKVRQLDHLTGGLYVG